MQVCIGISKIIYNILIICKKKKNMFNKKKIKKVFGKKNYKRVQRINWVVVYIQVKYMLSNINIDVDVLVLI